MPEDLLTPKNSPGFDAESLKVLNEAFTMLLKEYERRFAPAHIHRILLTAWTGKTTVEKLLKTARYELALE